MSWLGKLFGMAFPEKPIPAIPKADASPERETEGPIANDEHRSSLMTRESDLHDYLYLASKSGKQAALAAKAGYFDKAWGLYHEQKGFYLRHASRSNWNALDTVALDAVVSESLANILRLERRHSEALVHIIYWVSAHSRRPLKRHPVKLKAYLNRCSLQNTSYADVEALCSSLGSPPDFRVIQLKVQELMAKG